MLPFSITSLNRILLISFLGAVWLIFRFVRRGGKIKNWVSAKVENSSKLDESFNLPKSKPHRIKKLLLIFYLASIAIYLLPFCSFLLEDLEFIIHSYGALGLVYDMNGDLIFGKRRFFEIFLIVVLILGIMLLGIILRIHVTPNHDRDKKYLFLFLFLGILYLYNALDFSLSSFYPRLGTIANLIPIDFNNSLLLIVSETEGQIDNLVPLDLKTITFHPYGVLFAWLIWVNVIFNPYLIYFLVEFRLKGRVHKDLIVLNRRLKFFESIYFHPVRFMLVTYHVLLLIGFLLMSLNADSLTVTIFGMVFDLVFISYPVFLTFIFIYRYQLFYYLMERPILFLRSFNHKFAYVSYGEIVNKVARKFGTIFVVVHDDQKGTFLSRKVGPLNQERFNVLANENWKKGIQDLMRKSSFIIFDLTVPSEGVLWEYSCAKHLLPSNKIVKLVQVDSKNQLKEDEITSIDYHPISRKSLRLSRKKLKEILFQHFK